MTSQESNEELQKEELLALESIFCNGELQINSKPAWNAWAPIDISTEIDPTAATKTFVSVKLRVICGEDYPTTAPVIRLSDAVGLTVTQMDELRQQLEQMCSERASERIPVISELIETARDFLYQRNADDKDLHNRMLDDEKMKQKANKKQKAEKEREEQAEIEKANKQRLDRLNDQKADKEKERQRLKSCTAPEVEGLGEAIDVRAMDDSKLTVFVKTDVVAPHRTTKHPLCSEWIGYINHKGQVLVSEWRFEHTLGKERKASDSPNLKKFEKDLDEFVANVLRRLRSLDTMDQSMYAYQFVHLVKKSATPTNFKCSLLVGQLIPSEHQPLEIVMRDVKKRPKFFMPKFASAAVCALKWLHDQQLSHGALDKATAWFNKDYADPAFLISDFFILPGLVKLAKQFSATISPEGSPAPEAEELEVMKKAQQKDRFAVGSLMMDIHSESASDTKNIPNLCQDFIKTCQNEAFTTDHLLEHRYINHGFFEQLHVSRSSLSEDPVGNYESTASSRLMKDWAMRKRLGGGGFGDVILAKNKLDGNDYAIKRIKLSPGQSELTGRITQEAKVFSRLNHPNIVRYYNAWIENVIETGSDESASTIPTMSAPAEDSFLVNTKLQGIGSEGDQLPEMSEASEWTTSYGPVEESSSEDSSDDLFVNRNKVLFSPQQDSSCLIVFGEGDSDSDYSVLQSMSRCDESLATDSSEPFVETASTDTIDAKPQRVLYIQMEFCTKSTLRSLISGEHLFKQPKKIWRIFREVLNGLQYMHHLGIIHRDIKPMNILLGANDQAKIGDFGLATRGYVKRKRVSAEQSYLSADVDYTKDCGTAFYMAPELDSTIQDSLKNARISTRVDVYSLGVVLFEMFYNYLQGMERHAVMKNLRSSRTLPSEFGEDIAAEEANLAKRMILRMLEREPEDRPTVDEILASDDLPLIEVEPNDYQKMFLQITKNKRGPLCKWTFQSLFAGEPEGATTYLFDQMICVDLEKNVAKQNYIELIKEELSECFKLHAFVPLNTPSFVPYKSRSDSTAVSPVKVMDESGFVFTLPGCLRRNFIRYCNRTKMFRFKRYTFGKTFSKNEGGGSLHPNERLACAVDIVAQSSTAETMAAEILSVATFITSHLSSLKDLTWTLRIGHTDLIRAALMHLGITDEDIQRRTLSVMYTISTNNVGKLSRKDKQNKLILACSLKADQATSLLDILEPSEKIKVNPALRAVQKNRNEAIGNLSKKAFFELEGIARTFHLLCNEKQAKSITFDPMLCYRPDLFSDGFVFQLEITVPRSGGKEVIMPILAGGRYDKSLAAEHHASDPQSPAPISAIGFNLYVDTLANVAALLEAEIPVRMNSCSAIVCCSEGSLEKEKFQLAQKLRKHGIATDVLHEVVSNVDSLRDHCVAQKIGHLLVIKEEGVVLVVDPSEQKDNGVKLHVDEAILKVSSAGAPTSSRLRTADVPTSSPARQSTAFSATFSNVVWLHSSKKSSSERRKIEGQIQNHATAKDVVATFSGKQKIYVCICELPAGALRTFANKMDRSLTQLELAAVFNESGKLKQAASDIFSELKPLFGPDQAGEPIILYSMKDGYYRVIL